MVMRINGMTSGLDVDSAVSQLMKAQRMPVNKLLQSRQTLQWQRDGYREMNTKILDYRSNKLFAARLGATYSAKKVDITGDTAAVSVKPTGDAQNGQIKIDVTSLATATFKLGGDISSAPAFDPSGKLYDQRNNLNGVLADNTKRTLVINSTSIEVDPATQSLNDVISQINQKTTVNAFYDSVSGQISFSSKATGASSSVDFTGSNAVLKDILQVNAPATTAGLDAVIKINDIATTRASNAFTVNGVDITLLKATAVGTPAKLNMKTDTDTIVESIKSFITDYNDILKTLDDKVSEAKYRDFLPLTDDQKKDMKDADIKLWDDKSKSGLLKNDDILSKALSSMRNSISAIVTTGDTTYKTLSSIGIETGSYYDKGKLYLKNETKLRAAIDANPNAVKNMFSAAGTAASNYTDTGIAERMYTSLKTTMDEITQRAGNPSYTDSSSRDNSFIGQRMYRLNQDIDSKNVRLQDIEARYYKQFTAMETAMTKFNSQSAYLANALGGGQQ
jgi:flagellar hook-associated protein 2